MVAPSNPIIEVEVRGEHNKLDLDETLVDEATKI
jgi:hypothetical protein